MAFTTLSAGEAYNEKHGSEDAFMRNPRYTRIALRADSNVLGSTGYERAQLVKTSSSAMAERPRELGDFKKARVNGGTDNHSLKGFSQVSHTGELN